MTAYYPNATPVDYLGGGSGPPSGYGASPSYPHYVPAQYPHDIAMLPMQRFSSLPSLSDGDAQQHIIPVSPIYSIASASSFSSTSHPSWAGAVPSSASPSANSASTGASSASPPPSPSPFMPQYQHQFYTNGNFALEIPFADHPRVHAAAASAPFSPHAQPPPSPHPQSALQAAAAPQETTPTLPHQLSTSSFASTNSDASSASPEAKTRKRARGAASSPTAASQPKSKKSHSPPINAASASSAFPSAPVQSPSPPPSNLTPSEMKKAKHREIDAARRAREGAAVSRLHALIAGKTAANSASPAAAGPAVALGKEAAAAESEKDKKDKVGILEVVGDRIVELEKLCEKLKDELREEKDKNRELGDSIARMSKQTKMLMLSSAAAAAASSPASSSSSDAVSVLDPLYSLTPSAREYIHQLEQSSSLYASSFVHSSLILLILSVQSGKCVDANAKFCEMAGWSKEEIIGKSFCPTAHELLDPNQAQDDLPCTLASNPATAFSLSLTAAPCKTDKPAPSSPSGEPPMLSRHNRYNSNRSELVALYTGRKKTITPVFRVVLAKGQLIDARCRCWLGNGGAAEAGAGAAAAAGDESRIASHLIVQTTEEDIIMLS